MFGCRFLKKVTKYFLLACMYTFLFGCRFLKKVTKRDFISMYMHFFLLEFKNPSRERNFPYIL